MGRANDELLTNSEYFSRNLRESCGIRVLHAIGIANPFVEFVADLSHVVVNADQQTGNVRCHILAGVLVVMVRFQCLLGRLEEKQRCSRSFRHSLEGTHPVALVTRPIVRRLSGG